MAAWVEYSPGSSDGNTSIDQEHKSMNRNVRLRFRAVFSIGLMVLVIMFMWLHVECHHQVIRTGITRTGDAYTYQESITHRTLHQNSSGTTYSMCADTATATTGTVKPEVGGGKIPKVYIYDLHPIFNSDLKECVLKETKARFPGCFGLNNHGFGRLLYRDGEMGVYDTHQFSLEVVLHHQLMNSKYRTDNPEDADIFYIPSYLGLAHFCYTFINSMLVIQEELFKLIRSMPYFDQGRPHISSIAKIEREQATILRNPLCQKVAYIAIEKESNRMQYSLPNVTVIVAPYPSYVHRDYIHGKHNQAVISQSLHQRNIVIFLAAGVRRSNELRASLFDQFQIQFDGKSYDDYLKENNVVVPPEQVMLVTRECNKNHNNITIDWMQRSVFCLQPHGDSPTRKSFYDSIQSGCIPVIFKFDNERVEYPFENVLNYSDFIVSVDVKRIMANESILDIVKEIPPKEIYRLHSNVLLVARKLQYSVPDAVPKDSTLTDAMDMIIQQVVQIYKL